MPVMDGPTFLAAYHREPGPHAPVVLLSGQLSLPAGLDPSNVAGFLAKPFQLEDLLAVAARFSVSTSEDGHQPSPN